MAKGGPKVANASATEPCLLRREDMRLYTGLPKDDVYGYHRAQSTVLKGTHAQAGVVHLPVGQACVTHASPGEHFVYLLEGEMEYAFEGRRFRLKPHDMFFVPAHVMYQYRNVGFTDARFVNILARGPELPGQPTTSIYDYERDLGE